MSTRVYKVTPAIVSKSPVPLVISQYLHVSSAPPSPFPAARDGRIALTDEDKFGHKHAPAHLEAISGVGGTGATSVGWELEESWGTPLGKDGRGNLR